MKKTSMMLMMAMLVTSCCAQFGAFERPQINATSNFWAKGSITLGGVERYTWPSGGGGDYILVWTAGNVGTMTTSGGTNYITLTSGDIISVTSNAFLSSTYLTDITNNTARIVALEGAGYITAAYHDASKLDTNGSVASAQVTGLQFTNMNLGLFPGVSGRTLVIATNYVPNSRTLTINGRTGTLLSNLTYNVGTLTNLSLTSTGTVAIAGVDSNAILATGFTPDTYNGVWTNQSPYFTHVSNGGSLGANGSTAWMGIGSESTYFSNTDGGTGSIISASWVLANGSGTPGTTVAYVYNYTNYYTAVITQTPLNLPGTNTGTRAVEQRITTNGVVWSLTTNTVLDTSNIGSYAFSTNVVPFFSCVVTNDFPIPGNAHTLLPSNTMGAVSLNLFSLDGQSVTVLRGGVYVVSIYSLLYYPSSATLQIADGFYTNGVLAQRVYDNYTYPAGGQTKSMTHTFRFRFAAGQTVTPFWYNYNVTLTNKVGTAFSMDFLHD